LRESLQSSHAAELKSPPRQVDTKRDAVSFKESEVGPGSGTAIQDSRTGSACRCANQKRLDEAPEAAIPEVLLFGVVRLLEHAVHATNFMVLCALNSSIEHRTT